MAWSADSPNKLSAAWTSIKAADAQPIAMIHRGRPRATARTNNESPTNRTASATSSTFVSVCTHRRGGVAHHHDEDGYGVRHDLGDGDDHGSRHDPAPFGSARRAGPTIERPREHQERDQGERADRLRDDDHRAVRGVEGLHVLRGILSGRDGHHRCLQEQEDQERDPPPSVSSALHASRAYRS